MAQTDLRQQWLRMNQYEAALREQGIQRIAGIDEAGRGPLAGPVAAAAVILRPDSYIPGLNDSKKLSEKRRLALEPQIKEQALAWSCVMVDAQRIDEINILEATKQAMLQAVEQLQICPEHLLIDALKLKLDIPQTAIIKGDANSVSIAAASILAKNARDRLMYAYDLQYPQYGFAQHKGYPTAQHRQALREFGLCPIHRRSFRH